MKAAPVAAAKSRLWKIGQVEHRRRAAVLDPDEERQQDGGEDRGEPITSESSQPEMPPREIP